MLGSFRALVFVLFGMLALTASSRAAFAHVQDVDDARSEAARIDAIARRSDDRLAAREARRARMTTLAIALLAAFAIAAARVLASDRGRRARPAIRKVGPLAALYAAYVAAAGAVLATGYEGASPLPFLLFGAATLPIVLTARAWGAAGRATRPARAARSAISAAAILAVGFLVLRGLEPSYLDGLGL